jgi:hypothetical protein
MFREFVLDKIVCSDVMFGNVMCRDVVFRDDVCRAAVCWSVTHMAAAVATWHIPPDMYQNNYAALWLKTNLKMSSYQTFCWFFLLLCPLLNFLASHWADFLTDLRCDLLVLYLLSPLPPNVPGALLERGTMQTPSMALVRVHIQLFNEDFLRCVRTHQVFTVIRLAAAGWLPRGLS